MRVLGASVLVMESLALGFAILLATKDQSASTIIYGSIISFLLFMTAGFLKHRSAFYLASILQIFMISFGFFVPSFIVIGMIFAGLWVAAIIVGRKGEAARAALMAQAQEKGQ
ncbi:MAG: DUF4233 domain-containing protein [Candidatus Planktophila sp.]|nr:DUF4233 domain-containing protein [Candidatus Planktophila sp.]